MRRQLRKGNLATSNLSMTHRVQLRSERGPVILMSVSRLSTYSVATEGRMLNLSLTI